MVGADAPEKILKFYLSRLAKIALPRYLNYLKKTRALLKVHMRTVQHSMENKQTRRTKIQYFRYALFKKIPERLSSGILIKPPCINRSGACKPFDSQAGSGSGNSLLAWRTPFANQ